MHQSIPAIQSMSEQVIDKPKSFGLRNEDLAELEARFGKNVYHIEKPRSWLHMIRDIVFEPMFILLLVAALLYFFLREMSEGIMVIIAMLFVAGIALYQDVRSTNALAALKRFTPQQVTVIRSDEMKQIPSENLLPGDLIILEEGDTVPADGHVVRCNDFTIDESIVTGESFAVEKKVLPSQDLVYQGTTVNSGKAYAIVSSIGNDTVLGKVGQAIHPYMPAKTILQQQVNKFVRKLAYFGGLAFLIISVINYLNGQALLQSILFGLTLAMAAIPEEIPVAFSSFMALGAWKMSRIGIITRQPHTIENLGSVNVVCLDKTGTVTENKMTVVSGFDLGDNIPMPVNAVRERLIGYAMLASESEPFDAMEKAIHEAYQKFASGNNFYSFRQIYEYPLQGSPPMMTHIFEKETEKIIAAKGAPERIMKVCKMNPASVEKIMNLINDETRKGYRVIAVASGTWDYEHFPDNQDDFKWQFEGVIALYDPPRKNADQIISSFYDAKIEVKLITGDYPLTAINIAGQIGIKNHERYLTGNDVMQMSIKDLQETVRDITIFARMFPDAKLKVINAIKANGDIVAMSGDGVNDAPALQAAHVGIALGKRGTEMARRAADLVLTDDNLSRIIDAICHGRTILSNLKKAIRYIVSIHIPIILAASLPLLLGWRFPTIFSPIHIIFLELIMGPTCSIFFEREPVEKSVMNLPPRIGSSSLFRKDELLISIIQGLVITAGVLWPYYTVATANFSLEEVRTLVFTTMLFSNIFLTFSNRSFTETFVKTMYFKNNLTLWVILISLAFILSIHFISPIRNIFGLVSVSVGRFFMCILIAFISVAWFEVYKMYLTRFNSSS